jgi:hypothetical protein
MTPEYSEEESLKNQMPNLDIPNPPDNMSYADFEDYRFREILRVNGISLSEVELITALKQRTNVLQAAAAHTLGSLLSQDAISILKKLVSSSEDLVKVEAAYALARLGAPEGKYVLIQCLNYTLDAYLFPAIAAGYLVRLGDPRGFKTIVRCFDVDIPEIRMLACKQLYFFVPFQGVQDKDGNTIDVYGLFDRALKDSDTDIQWQALVQLREIGSSNAGKILESYIIMTANEELRDVAKAILKKK